MRTLPFIRLLLLVLLQGIVLKSSAQPDWAMQPIPVTTRWASQVSLMNVLPEYPRPQMVRQKWQNLNGLWKYAITDTTQAQASFEGQILVPYPLESALSGVQKRLTAKQFLWYKRTFTTEKNSKGKTLLHFGAVDQIATVFVNGEEIGRHEGGYTSFSFDITHVVRNNGNEIVVKVYDPTDQGIWLHGKQVTDPKDIYYTPTSGIWQTVWLEQVPEKYIESLTITPDLDKGTVNIVVDATGNENVRLTAAGKTVTGKANRNIVIPINDVHSWSPGDPYLYDLIVKMGDDEVKSYFGMRKVSIVKDKEGNDSIALNNQIYFNLGTLDQGFWPDGLYTAPIDEALKFDIQAIKAMGFNTIRKHIKIEPARWYYWADKLGMLVWQDFVNPNQSLPEGSKAAFERQGAEMLTQLHNHPSITTWVLFNEKWGQYDQERLTKWIKDTDPSRLVNGHSGEYLYVNNKLRSPSPNAYIHSDITDIHSYPDPMNSLKMEGKARVCGEFGGIGVFIPDHQWDAGAAWGYINEKPAALKFKYEVMNLHLKMLEKEGLSGSIYTQPFDVEGEQNGLMTYDREIIKIPFAELRRIHSTLNPDANKNIPDVTAINADLTEPAQVYATAIREYLAGDQDAAFLKKLVMLASQNNDIAGKARFGTEYIKQLKSPCSPEDMSLILSITTHITDKGFPLLIKESATNRKAAVTAQHIIYGDLIEPVAGNNARPDWTAIWDRVKLYGSPGEEIYLRARTIYALNQQDWENYKPAATEYLKKYGNKIAANEKGMFEKNIAEH